MRITISLYVGGLLGLFLISAARGAGPETVEEALFRRAELPSDDGNLIAYLRGRSLAPGDAAQIEAVVEQLGHQRFAVRRQAMTQLIAVGRPALPVLRKHFTDGDVFLARRAKESAERIEADSPEAHIFLPLASVRLLATRKADGAVAALLRFLPTVSQADVEEEICCGLDALALRDGKLHPALAAALTDAAPARRAVAACLAGRLGDAEQKAAASKLLGDAAAVVRLRAAQGLLAGKDAAGVPALVELLEQAPLELAWQAEELLRWLGREQSPQPLGGKPTAERRRQCREDWQQWWKKTGNIDWRALEQSGRRPGLLVVQELLPLEGQGPKAAAARKSTLVVVGCDGAVRCRIDAPAGMSSRWCWLPGRKLLAWFHTEPGGAVRLLDADGSALWERSMRAAADASVDVRPLPDGGVHVVSGRQRLILDGKGRVVREWEAERMGLQCHLSDLGHWFCCDGLARDREISIWRSDPVDDKGRDEIVLKEQPPHGRLLAFQALPHGRYLLQLRDNEKRTCEVREIDAAGRMIWRSARSEGFAGAIRLRNGNTLLVNSNPVSHQEGKELSWLLEVDEKDRLLWEMPFTKGVARVQDAFPLLRLGFDGPRGELADLDRPAHWLASMKDPDPEVRRRAAKCLLAAKLTDAELQAAYAYMTDPDCPVSQTIIKLAEANPCREGGAALSHLLAALDCHPTALTHAVHVIPLFGEEALAPLLKIVDDPKASSVKRARAAMTLGAWLNRPDVAPVLRRLLQDRDVYVKCQTVRGIIMRRENARPWVPELVRIMNGKDEELADETLKNIQALMSASDAVVPALIDLAKDPERPERQVRALEALNFIGFWTPKALRSDPRLVGEMCKLLDSKNRPRVCGAAANVLRWLGAEAKDAVSALIKAMHDTRPMWATGDEPVGSVVNEVLQTFGPAAAAAAPNLLRTARDSRNPPRMRLTALDALSATRVKGNEVSSALLSLIREEKEDNEVARVAYQILKRTDPAAVQADQSLRRRFEPPLPVLPVGRNP